MLRHVQSDVVQQTISSVSLVDLLSPSGLGIPLSTLEHIVSTLDGAAQQRPWGQLEQWRYRFAWQHDWILIIGFDSTAMMYGTNTHAMTRLTTVLTSRCLEVLAAAWRGASEAIERLYALLDGYNIDRSSPWHGIPASLHLRYCHDLTILLASCADLPVESYLLIHHTLIRRGMPQVALWLDSLLVAYDLGRVQEPDDWEVFATDASQIDTSSAAIHTISVPTTKSRVYSTIDS